MCPENDPSLDAAYALSTPEDSKRLYADWADTYDQDFAASSDYNLHIQVARQFAVAGGIGPVLDVGAGTGLLADALAPLIDAEIDGTDISAEMLEKARAKGIYRHLFSGDLTRTLPVPDGTYKGITSSGTFTNGHVGPEAIDELLRITASKGLIALSINAQHYASAGFAAKLDSISAQITDLRLPEVRIYGDTASGDHKDDTALIALFRKR
ncbi:MAG: class I SAM-dependent methyltransferase [Shimia sp.]|nr:class I SAM-dependent methyltransferase [Shimia sp.]